MHAVCYCSVLQAHQASDMCLAAMLMSISPSNCLAIYQLACDSGLQELAARARQEVLGSFPQALAQDPKTFHQLPAPALLSLLQDDDLQCPESEVLLSLIDWSNASDAPQRRTHLMGMAKRCVRMSQLSLKQVELLDQHPQVVSSQEATRLVAGLYLAIIMGCKLPGSRRRRTAASVHDYPRCPSHKGSLPSLPQTMQTEGYWGTVSG